MSVLLLSSCLLAATPRPAVFHGVSFHQGALAFTGSATALSGLATIINPAVWAREGGEKEVVSAQERSRRKLVTDMMGWALVCAGIGKLSVLRGFERAFCRFNVLPVIGSLLMGRGRINGLALKLQACTALLYTYIGFGPRKTVSRGAPAFLSHLPEQRVYRA